MSEKLAGHCGRDEPVEVAERWIPTAGAIRTLPPFQLRLYGMARAQPTTMPNLDT